MGITPRETYINAVDSLADERTKGGNFLRNRVVRDVNAVKSASQEVLARAADVDSGHDIPASLLAIGGRLNYIDKKLEYLTLHGARQLARRSIDHPTMDIALLWATVDQLQSLSYELMDTWGAYDGDTVEGLYNRTLDTVGHSGNLIISIKQLCHELTDVRVLKPAYSN